MASGVGETGEGCGAGEVRRSTVWQQSIARGLRARDETPETPAALLLFFYRPIKN
jgi:hypothetical protein